MGCNYTIPEIRLSMFANNAINQALASANGVREDYYAALRESANQNEVFAEMCRTHLEFQQLMFYTWEDPDLCYSIYDVCHIVSKFL